MPQQGGGVARGGADRSRDDGGARIGGDALMAHAVVIPRDVVRVVGPDAANYLQGQLSQDVEGLAADASAWSFVLQPQGKLDAVVRVTREADDSFLLDLDAGF